MRTLYARFSRRARRVHKGRVNIVDDIVVAGAAL